MASLIILLAVFGMPFLGVVFYRQACRLQEVKSKASTPNFYYALSAVFFLIFFADNFEAGDFFKYPEKERTVLVPERLLNEKDWFNIYQPSTTELKKRTDSKGHYISKDINHLDKVLIFIYDAKSGVEDSAIGDVAYDFGSREKLILTDVKKKKNNHSKLKPFMVYERLWFEKSPEGDVLGISNDDRYQKNKQPFYKKAIKVYLDQNRLTKSFNFRFTNRFYNHSFYESTFIPYSSKEKMVEVSWRQLHVLVEPSWNYTGLNIGAYEARKQWQQEKKSKFMQMVAFSPIWLYLPNWQWFILITVMGAGLLVWRKNVPFAFLIATLVLMLFSYGNDYFRHKKNLRAFEDAHQKGEQWQELLARNNNTRYFRENVRNNYRSILQQTQQSDAVNFMPLYLSDQFLGLNDYPQFDIVYKTGNREEVTEIKVFVQGRKLTCYLPSKSAIKFNEIRGHSTWDKTRAIRDRIGQLMLREFLDNPQLDSFVADIDYLQVAAIRDSRAEDQSHSQFVMAQCAKLRNSLRNHPLENSKEKE